MHVSNDLCSDLHGHQRLQYAELVLRETGAFPVLLSVSDF